jgi:glycosyltransferase involved in cell wall biosynthesis
LLISPTRDEADHAIGTLESVVQQTCLPARWIIVDDGSTDDTPQILRHYAEAYPFIEVVRRDDRGRRRVGPGVIDAFYEGLRHVNLDRYPYLGKVDLDLELPPRYFQTLIERMEAAPRLGTCSGKPYYRLGGRLISEGCGDEMSVGMTKFYRTACFQDIGGFARQVMWDGVDCHHCRMRGWLARSWGDEPALRFVHRRPMGSSDRGILRGRMRHGYGQACMGTGVTYITVSALHRLRFRPRVIGALAMWSGYMLSRLRRDPGLRDRALRRFIRTYQWQCLLMGKARATRRIERRQADQWHKHHYTFERQDDQADAPSPARAARICDSSR